MLSRRLRSSRNGGDGSDGGNGDDKGNGRNEGNEGNEGIPSIHPAKGGDKNDRKPTYVQATEEELCCVLHT